MGYTVTQDVATRIKPELVIQQLKSIPALKDGMETKNIFKRERSIMDTHIVVNSKTKAVKYMPYVDQASRGIALGSTTENDVRHTVPPMKAHARLWAKDLKKIQHLKQIDFMRWLREEVLTDVQRDIDYSLENLKRTMLATGDLSYKYLQGTAWNTWSIDFGTAVAGGTFTNTWDTAGTTKAQMHQELNALVRTAQNTSGSESYFKNSSEIKFYMPDAVWNAAFAKLDGAQGGLDTVGSAVLSENDIRIGSYILSRFPANYTDPETGIAADAITAKTIRMVDVSANAPHTLTFLELDNVNAVNGNSHILIQVIPDPYGEYIDIQVQMRPIPVFVAPAMAIATVLS